MLFHISRTRFIRLIFLLMLLAVCLGVLAIYFESTQIVKNGNAKFETIDWIQHGVKDASRGLLGFVFIGDDDDKNTFEQAFTNVSSFNRRYQLLGHSKAEVEAINELTILLDEYFNFGRTIIAQKEDILELLSEYEDSITFLEDLQDDTDIASTTESKISSGTPSATEDDNLDQTTESMVAEIDMADIQLKEKYISALIRDFEKDGEKIEVLLQERLRASALKSIGWKKTYINISVYLIGIIMVLGSFGGIWHVNVMRSSLLRLRNVAENMVQGDLTRKAEADTEDEVGQVASRLNLLADKLAEEMDLRNVIVNLIPDSFMVLDKNGNIVEVNEIALDTSGYSTKDLIGKDSNTLLQNIQTRREKSGGDNSVDKTDKENT